MEKVSKKTVEKTENQKERKLSLEEKRLVELRKEINNNALLDEYTILYSNMVLSYAAQLKINFDNLQ